jgi:hypothetical protein
MKLHYKEYNFSEWLNLSEDKRREIQNHYWTPFDTKIGEKTRHKILEEFIKTIDCDYYLCKFGYFAHYVIGIRVIPKDSKKRIPNDYHGIIINKGVILNDHGDGEYTVRWRHSGKPKITLD